MNSNKNIQLKGGKGKKVPYRIKVRIWDLFFNRFKGKSTFINIRRTMINSKKSPLAMSQETIRRVIYQGYASKNKELKRNIK